MTLPAAFELDAIFAAARRHGVTHLRIGGLEVRLVAQTAGERTIDEIARTAPLPGSPSQTAAGPDRDEPFDPRSLDRPGGPSGHEAESATLADAIMSGARFVPNGA